MAENRIYTKIALKYNDYAYWTTGAGKDYTPLKGEVCFCAIPAGNAAATTAPTVLFKVGNGTDKFSALKWASALAADVYDWAKVDADTFLAWLGEQGVDTNTTYNFSVPTTGSDAGKLVVEKKEVGETTWTKVGAYDFVTPGELETVLEGYKTKQEVYTDPNYAAGKYVSKVTQNENGEITVVHESLPEIPEETELTITDKTYTDDADTFYAVTNLVEGGDYGHTITPTYNPVPTKKYVDDALQAAKDYADEKPHENTAHTHIVGLGTQPTANGGINGEVGIDLNIGIKLGKKTVGEVEKDYLIIYDLNNNEEVASMDAADFIEDSYLNDVEINGTDLEFTWNMADGTTKTDVVDLKSLVDVYTGETTDTIKVTVDGYKIKADLLKNYKELQTEVANKITDKAHVLTSLTQDENGVISYEVKKLTPEDIGAAPADDYKTRQEAKTFTGSTVKTVTKVEQNDNGEVEVTYDNIAFPEFPELPAATGSAVIASVANNIVTLKASAVLGEDENGDHKLANGTEADITLAKVAKTGSVYDVEEASEAEDGTKYLILDCNW